MGFFQLGLWMTYSLFSFFFQFSSAEDIFTVSPVVTSIEDASAGIGVQKNSTK